jgi:hypothetical protein
MKRKQARRKIVDGLIEEIQLTPSGFEHALNLLFTPKEKTLVLDLLLAEWERLKERA